MIWSRRNKFCLYLIDCIRSLGQKFYINFLIRQNADQTYVLVLPHRGYELITSSTVTKMA